MGDDYALTPNTSIKKTKFSRYKFYPLYLLAMILVTVYFFNLSLKAIKSIKVFQVFQKSTISLSIKNDPDSQLLLTIEASQQQGISNMQYAIKENQNGLQSESMTYLTIAEGDFEDIKLRSQLLKDKLKSTPLQSNAGAYLQVISQMKQGIANSNKQDIAMGIKSFEALSH